MKKLLLCISIIFFCVFPLKAQPVPTAEENIPYLVTFGNDSKQSWGDDDFCQVFFFLIPKTHKLPFYIRVFDPDVGGEIDEQKEEYNTTINYSIYGGKKAYSNPDARQTNPVGNYKSGNLLASKDFSISEKYDSSWYSFGPFNPTEGEYIEKFSGYIFKVIAEGMSGDDGNLYKYYLSTTSKENKPIEGGNAFTYEYTFRLYDDPRQLSHIYPYVDDKVISIKQENFDWDNDGFIRIVSVAKRGEICEISGDNNWNQSKHIIVEEEKNTSLDIQFIKNRLAPVKSNNVVLFITNQYGELLPFYTTPIGGVPKYSYNIGVKRKN